MFKNEIKVANTSTPLLDAVIIIFEKNYKKKINVVALLQQFELNSISNINVNNSKKILESIGISLFEVKNAEDFDNFDIIVERNGEIFIIYKASNNSVLSEIEKDIDGTYWKVIFSNIPEEYFTRSKKKVMKIQYIFGFFMVFLLEQYIYYSYLEIIQNLVNNVIIKGFPYLLLAMFIAALLAYSIELLTFQSIYINYKVDVEDHIPKKLISRGQAYFQIFSVGEIATKVGYRTNYRDNIVIKGSKLFFEIIALIIASIYLIFISLKLFLLVLLIISINFLISRVFQENVHKSSKMLVNSIQALSKETIRFIGNIKIVKTDEMSSYTSKLWNELNQKKINKEFKLMRVQLLFKRYISMYSYLSVLILLLVVKIYAPIDLLVAYSIYLFIDEKFVKILFFYNSIVNNKPKMRQFDDVFEVQENKKFSNYLYWDEECVSLINVMHSYNTKNVFEKNLHITFPKGVTILAGANGSGKTTIFNLLMNIETLQTGSIYLPQNSTISPFIQNSEIVYKNINDLYESECNESCFQLEYLLREFNVLDIYTKYKYLSITELQLSEGQKRKLQIIKVLLSKNNILLFDEPEAFLDEKSQKVFWNVIHTQENIKEKIVIIISHKYDYMSKTDTIINL